MSQQYIMMKVRVREIVFLAVLYSIIPNGFLSVCILDALLPAIDSLWFSSCNHVVLDAIAAAAFESVGTCPRGCQLGARVTWRYMLSPFAVPILNPEQITNISPVSPSCVELLCINVTTPQALDAFTCYFGHLQNNAETQNTRDPTVVRALWDYILLLLRSGRYREAVAWSSVSYNRIQSFELSALDDTIRTCEAFFALHHRDRASFASTAECETTLRERKCLDLSLRDVLGISNGTDCYSDARGACVGVRMRDIICFTTSLQAFELYL